MSQQTRARKEIEAALVAKAQAEPAFRESLLKNAKEAIENQFGITLPPSVELKVVEETQTTNYLVLPSRTEGELSDDDLNAVAGGWCMAVLARAIADVEFGTTKDKLQSERKQTDAIKQLR